METFLYWLAQIGLIIAVLLVVGVPMWIYESRAKRKELEQAFTSRERLDEQAFYDAYFQSRGVPVEVVIRVRRVLEEVLDADLSRLKAEDDLTKSLSFLFQYDSMAGVVLVERLEEEFSVKIEDAEAEKTRTVEDIVNLVWRKLRQDDA